MIRPFIAAAETLNLEEVKWLWACDEQKEKEVKKNMDLVWKARETVGSMVPFLKSLQATSLVDADAKSVLATIEDLTCLHSVAHISGT